MTSNSNDDDLLHGNDLLHEWYPHDDEIPRGDDYLPQYEDLRDDDDDEGCYLQR